MKWLVFIFLLAGCQTTPPEEVSDLYYACDLGDGSSVYCRTLDTSPCGLTLKHCDDHIVRYCTFGVVCFEFPFYRADLKFLKPLPLTDEDT